jgi:glycosyltransferase involved in cell wall biosynthesis
MVRFRKLLKRVSRKQKDLSNLVTKSMRRWRMFLSVKHLYGPRNISYAPDELVIICLVRNGRRYIKSFVDYHISLGAKHIVFVDNGSDDGTVSIAQEYESVTIIQTRLPFWKYEVEMRWYAISRFGKGRWTLWVDIDELFDYPYSDVVSLSSLLRYLNGKSYTAVVTQVLDMFPNRSLSGQASEEDESVRELYKFYDLSNIKRKDYPSRRGRRSNVTANDDIKKYRDGIRTTLFGAPFALTRHSLIFFDGKVRPGRRGVHGIENARIADFSCVLYHYKLVDGFSEQAAQAVREESYHPELMLRHYKVYHEMMKQNPDIRMSQDTARELGGVNELIDNGFLVVSCEYKRWADAEKKNKTSPGPSR